VGIDRATLTRQIKEANDIVAVIGSYIPLLPTGNPDVYKAVCPFHDDHRPSLQVSARFQNFRCWSCGKKGGVFDFVMEFEKISFLEARALLARRANIPLDQASESNALRWQQLEAIRWAADLYHQCLLNDAIATRARTYLGERGILGETVRRFALGFAPGDGDWLVAQARQASVALERLEEVGLVARSQTRQAWYDRFRDRVIFPVRSLSGQTIAFGGRILPDSPFRDRAPKYYNSTETPLFSKSEHLYGLDQARSSAVAAGTLVIVEGYTDVLMAHQSGITNVVATMGTALTPKHVQVLQRLVPRVVLVFDADEGGATGVDRALSIFARHHIELAIARLPEGTDPCDLIGRAGADAFRRVLDSAVDALDYKLEQLSRREAGHGIEGQRRAADEVLTILAAMPDQPDAGLQMKRDMMVTRLASRFQLSEERVRQRLADLKSRRQERDDGRLAKTTREMPARRSARAPAHEIELMQVLLAEPSLVGVCQAHLPESEISHPGLRQIVAALYDLHRNGQAPDLEALHNRITHPELLRRAIDWRDIGRECTVDRRDWLNRLLGVFERIRQARQKQQWQGELKAAADHEAAKNLLRKLQENQVGSDR
jgi:DNA primase